MYPSITQTVSRWSVKRSTKGIVVSQLFFEGPKNRNLTFCLWAFWFSPFLAGFLRRKSKKVSDCFYVITNCENPSRNPLQRACSGFLIAACVSKSCSKSRWWSLKIVPKAGYECTVQYTVKNRPMRAKESQDRNLMQLSEQYLELKSIFKEANKNLIFIFLLHKAGKKCTESTDLIV